MTYVEHMHEANVERFNTYHGSVQPPYNLEAEMAVIGAVLIDEQAYHYAAPIVQVESFYAVKHQWIWLAFQRLIAMNMAIDVMTVSTELNRHNQLGDVGGDQYLTRMVVNTSTAYNVASYAREVSDMYTRRRMLTAAQKAAVLAYDVSLNPDELMADYSAVVSDVMLESGAAMVQSAADVSDALYQEMIEAMDAEERGDNLVWPITPLQECIGSTAGEAGDVIVIAGRPGMGKTSFMVRMLWFNAQYAARHGGRGGSLMLSLEMRNTLLMRRVYSQVTGMQSDLLRNTRSMRPEQWEKFTSAMKEVSTWPFDMIDVKGSTDANKLLNTIRSHAMRQPLHTVFIDYLQIMTNSTENPALRFSEIMRDVKKCARELGIRIVIGCQIGRGAGDQRPTMADLKWSGGIEENADTIIAIHQDPMQHNIRELIILKNRNGATELRNQFSGHTEPIHALWVGKSTNFVDGKGYEIDLEE